MYDKEQKCKQVIMNSLRETFEALKNSNSKEAREQKKILAAAVTSLEYGVPNLGLTSGVEKEVVIMKERLMRGEDMILELPEETEAVSVDISTKNHFT